MENEWMRQIKSLSGLLIQQYQLNLAPFLFPSSNRLSANCPLCRLPFTRVVSRAVWEGFLSPEVVSVDITGNFFSSGHSLSSEADREGNHLKEFLTKSSEDIDLIQTIYICSDKLDRFFLHQSTYIILFWESLLFPSNQIKSNQIHFIWSINSIQINYNLSTWSVLSWPTPWTKIPS